MSVQPACGTVVFRHWTLEVALDEIHEAGLLRANAVSIVFCRP
jgi:hypothetical protein